MSEQNTEWIQKNSDSQISAHCSLPAPTNAKLFILNQAFNKKLTWFQSESESGRMVIPLIWQSSYPTKIFPLKNIFNKRILFKSYPEKHQNWNELQLLDCCQDVNVGRGFHLLIPLSRHIAVGAMWREVGWVGWEWGRWVNVWWGRGITTTIITFPQPSF